MKEEERRGKGQFWTPPWVAEPMVAWALADGARDLFDPAVGAGAFFLAARAHRVRLSGMELDPAALAEARGAGVREADLDAVVMGDFLAGVDAGSSARRGARGGAGVREAGTHPAIVANPPYIRHHRIPVERKNALGAWASRVIGAHLDRRAGLHVYFLIHALQQLAPGGRLAFIVPADTCEGVFAAALWRWIASRFRIDGVVTFAPMATPFPGVDTNAVILLIRNEPPEKALTWVRCEREGVDFTAGFTVKSGERDDPPSRRDALLVCIRTLDEAIATGLSRVPAGEPERGKQPSRRSVNGTDAVRPALPTVTLGDLAIVRRGIATGANDFFFLTRERAKALDIPRSSLLPAIGRTRDVDGDTVTSATLDALDRRGRSTRLLSLDGTPAARLPRAVRVYLAEGEARGLPARALIATRHPWYRMERRDPPPFLFAYLGRRSARFIRNEAGVVPLTGFLCVYPRRGDAAFLRALWKVLADPRTVANLARIGKSYGGGAIKVEPRALERLPIPADVVESAGAQSLGLMPAKPRPRGAGRSRAPAAHGRREEGSAAR